MVQLKAQFNKIFTIAKFKKLFFPDRFDGPLFASLTIKQWTQMLSFSFECILIVTFVFYFQMRMIKVIKNKIKQKKLVFLCKIVQIYLILNVKSVYVIFNFDSFYLFALSAQPYIIYYFSTKICLHWDPRIFFKSHFRPQKSQSSIMASFQKIFSNALIHLRFDAPMNLKDPKVLLKIQLFLAAKGQPQYKQKEKS